MNSHSKVTHTLTTREVIVSESTEHPNSAWVEKQADWSVDQTAGRDEKPDIIMHDKGTKFSKEFAASSSHAVCGRTPYPRHRGFLYRFASAGIHVCSAGEPDGSLRDRNAVRRYIDVLAGE